MSRWRKWEDPEHLWRSPQLPEHLVDAQRRRDVGALRRKITYVLNPDRLDMPVQLHPVEGMTTDEVVHFMVAHGVPEKRIRSDIERRRAILDQSRTLVNDHRR